MSDTDDTDRLRVDQGLLQRDAEVFQFPAERIKRRMERSPLVSSTSAEIANAIRHRRLTGVYAYLGEVWNDARNDLLMANYIKNPPRPLDVKLMGLCFESLKALMLASYDESHPFQDLANEMFVEIPGKGFVMDAEAEVVVYRANHLSTLKLGELNYRDVERSNDEEGIEVNVGEEVEETEEDDDGDGPETA